MQKVFWDENVEPVTCSIQNIMDNLFNDDMKTGLLGEPCTLDDIMEEYGNDIVLLDALTIPYARLETKLRQMQLVMNRAVPDLTVLSSQISDPFMRQGTANIVAIFELSDGQTISIYFHNPDVNPKKIDKTDELISYKWLLNKKDITIVVAPERGRDINIRQVALRVMKLADKNSAAFKRQNQKRAERLERIDEIKQRVDEKQNLLNKLIDEIAVLEMEIADKQIDQEDDLKKLTQEEPQISPKALEPEQAEIPKEPEKTGSKNIDPISPDPSVTERPETGSSKVDKSTALLFLTDILAGKYDQDLLEPEFADKLIPIAEKYESGGDQEMLNLLEKAVEYYINKNDANAVRGE